MQKKDPLVVAIIVIAAIVLGGNMRKAAVG